MVAVVDELLLGELVTGGVVAELDVWAKRLDTEVTTTDVAVVLLLRV